MDNKYINTYIDVAIGTIHEYLATNIQLKTQTKLANDLVAEKDKIIASLQADISSINKNNTDIQSLQNSAKNWEESYNAMKTKIGHMETLTKQLIEMKREIVNRDEKIKELEDKLGEINKKGAKKQPPSENKTKVKKEVVVLNEQKEIEKLPIDDF
jgi:chromosome segregation ATPase